MFTHLALTLLQQSHLCPLPLVVQPVHWMFDHVMQLYPLPHAVVLADTSPQASYKHEGCHVINPVSYACLCERLPGVCLFLYAWYLTARVQAHERGVVHLFQSRLSTMQVPCCLACLCKLYTTTSRTRLACIRAQELLNMLSG
jgi:hypothetical protein